MLRSLSAAGRRARIVRLAAMLAILVGYVDLVRGGIVFDGDPHDLPALWHDPSHAH